MKVNVRPVRLRAVVSGAPEALAAARLLPPHRPARLPVR